MFGQILDILLKKNEDKLRIMFIFLKIILTATIVSKIYTVKYGDFSLIPITEYAKYVDFILKGNAIIIIVLFFLIWVLFYYLPTFLLTPIVFKLTPKIFSVIEKIINVNPKSLKTELDSNDKVPKPVRKIINILNTTDVLEVESTTIKPGKNFYKFYDFIFELNKGTRSIDTEQFNTIIGILFQIVVVYFWFNMNFLSIYFSVKILAIITFVFLFIFSIFGFIFATLIDMKQKRILDFLEKISPNYKKENTDYKRNANH